MHRIITYRTDRQMSESFLTATFLSLSGGLQDAYTYIFRGKVFANAQTGNIVLMAQALYDHDWAGALRYLIPLLAFASGIAVTEVVRQRYRTARRIHWRQLILFAEIVLLFVVAFIPTSLNNLANALVSFSCAMQVQAFRKVDGYAFASTMCMGDMRSGVESLVNWCRTHDAKHRHKAIRYFGVIVLFALGAAAGGQLVESRGAAAIWASCALLFAGFALMFIREEIGEHEEELLADEEAILVDLHDIGESVSEAVHEIEHHIEDEIHHLEDELHHLEGRIERERKRGE